jgi:tRNA isopentenyl-2-thiomethyl-A-37 hydroxylase MiaE
MGLHAAEARHFQVYLGWRGARRSARTSTWTRAWRPSRNVEAELVIEPG